MASGYGYDINLSMGTDSNSSDPDTARPLHLLHRGIRARKRSAIRLHKIGTKRMCASYCPERSVSRRQHVLEQAITAPRICWKLKR